MHLSGGGNYSTTPSPVTRGLGEWGCFKGRLGGTGRHGVGGCCYPKSNWPETSCAVPADFHNDRISPLTHTVSHTHKEKDTHRHSISLSFYLIMAVLNPFFFIWQITIWPFAQVKFSFSLFAVPSVKATSNSLKDGNQRPVVHWLLQMVRSSILSLRQEWL